MFQTSDRSQLLRRVLWINAQLTIVWSLKHKITQPIYIFNRENSQNSESPNGPRRGLDFIALVMSKWPKKCTRLLAHSPAPAVSMILMRRVEKTQDLACCHFQENFCIYPGISVSCHFCMIYLCMCNNFCKKVALQILIPQYMDFNTNIVPDLHGL